MEMLSTQYSLHWSLLRWVASFLQGRAQVTRVGAWVSAPLYLNGGIPHGTKLGPVLFAVMVNDLVQSWGARIKFVDDLTVLEVVPRNSPSLMNVVVDDRHAFAVNNMRLNTRKRKTMTVDFLHYNSWVPRPIAVGGSDIDQVSTPRCPSFWGPHLGSAMRLHSEEGQQTALCTETTREVQSSVGWFCSYLLRAKSLYTRVRRSADLPKYLACYLENVQKSRPFPSFGLVFRTKQHLAKLHYPLFLTVGKSRVLNL